MMPEMKEEYAWFTLLEDEAAYERWIGVGGEGSDTDERPDKYPCFAKQGADGSETWYTTYLYLDTLSFMKSELENRK